MSTRVLRSCILSFNILLLVGISHLSGPACLSDEEAATISDQTICGRGYGMLAYDPDWSMVGLIEASETEVWTNPSNIDLALTTASKDLLTHQQAIDYCGSLTVEDFSGAFRLPTEAELVELDTRYDLSQLPVFAWTVCQEESGFKSGDYWVSEKTLAIDAVVVISPIVVVPYPTNAGMAFHIYESGTDEDATVYVGTQRAQLDGKASVICVADIE